MPGRFQIPRHRVGPLGRRAVRHLQSGRDEVPFHDIGESRGDDTRRQQGDAEYEQRDGPGDRDRGLAGRKPQGPVQGAIHKHGQLAVDIALGPREEPVEAIGRHPFRTVQVGEVVREDQQ